MNLSVLQDVFDAFVLSSTKTLQEMCSFDFTEFEEHTVHFNYNGKIWTGTTEKRFADYNQVRTQFVNIKLPNDGFIYTQKYKDSSINGDELLINEESTGLIKRLLDACEFKDYNVRLNYKMEQGRFEIYCINKDTTKHQIFTIKFEYDTYDYNNHSRKYNSKQIKSLIKQFSTECD